MKAASLVLFPFLSGDESLTEGYSLPLAVGVVLHYLFFLGVARNFSGTSTEGNTIRTSAARLGTTCPTQEDLVIRGF